MNTYEIGDMVTVKATFRDRNRVLTDPTIVTLRIRTPAGTTLTYVYPNIPVVKDSVGVYHADVDTSLFSSGLWVYNWSGTGNAQAADEKQFQTRASVFF